MEAAFELMVCGIAIAAMFGIVGFIAGIWWPFGLIEKNEKNGYHGE